MQKITARLSEHASESSPSGVIFLLKTLLIVLACLTVYIPAMRAGFVWDDDSMLTGNIVLDENGLYQSWFTTKQGNYWPITWTSYWLEHKLWKLKPAGYHITNILIHTVCSLLIWRILVQLNIPAAFAAAIIFAVHPVNVESVAWIAQRKTILAMLFFLLSLFYYLRFDQTGRRVFYALSVILFILAMLSKGSVVGLPVVILLCVWWLRGIIARRDIIRSIPFFVVSAVMSAVEIWFQYSRAIGEDVVRSDSFPSRLAGAGWAVWFYLYKAVLPVNLAFIYPRWKINPANLVSYVPGLLLVILLVVAWRYRRGWGRPVFFALSFYVVMLLPVLGFFNIYFMRYSFVADHYQYVSIISVICLVVGVIYRYLGLGVLRIAAILALIILGTAAWQRSSDYRNSETLWYDTLAKDPNSWMAHNEVGLIIKSQGRPDEAAGHYRKALELKPDYVEAYNNLGNTFQFQRKFDEAVEYYRQALNFAPKSAETHNNLGAALQRLGRLDEAISHFREALKKRPDFVEALNNLGYALQSQEKTDEAIICYQHALKIRPLSAEVNNNMGIALVAKGKLDEAVAHYRRALLTDPNYADVYQNLGQTLEMQGRFDEAAENFAQALRVKPDFAEAHSSFARSLSMVGKFEDALVHYRQSLKIKPDYTKSLNGLAWILVAHPDPNICDANEAVILAERAARLTNYGDATILNTLSAAYAAKGRFSEAIATAQKALDIAKASRNDQLADFIRRQLEMYKQEKFIKQ